MSLLAFDLVKIGANLTMTCIILFFAEPMLRLEMMFALSTIRDYRPFPFYVLACSLSVLRVLFREDTFYSCKYSAFLALFPLLLKKYHVFSHLGSAEFRNRHVYILPQVLTLLFGGNDSFFVRGLLGDFVTRTILTNSLIRAKRKRLPTGAFAKDNGGRGSDLGVFFKVLIINNSAIVETSSELISTSSELIRTRSELISTIAELISTIAEEI